jgi:hypothetical protein
MTVKKLLGTVTLALAMGGALYAAPTATALTGAKAALAATSLDLASMLTYAIQDERIARTEYEVILERFGSQRPFANIVQAERTHESWLLGLFAAHGIAVPSDATARPIAPKDWATAIEAGRQAEIDNIAMYDRFLAQSLPADVRQVFEQLKAGSQNHLRAFTTNRGRTT